MDKYTALKGLHLLVWVAYLSQSFKTHDYAYSQIAFIGVFYGFGVISQR
jgi:hypothetical protein